MAFTLPRLPPFYTDDQLQIWWQQFAEAIEDALNDIQGQVTDIAVALATANAAQTDATAAAREAARINSYPSPGNIISAADAGANATITIAAHTRVYPVRGTVDVPDLVIPAPSNLTGVTSGVRVWVYYDDTTLQDTTPSYQWTTSSATAQAGAAAGRHLVGYVDTPAAGGGGSASGSGGGAPGGGGGGTGTGYVTP